jgi:regulatory protein
MDDQLYKTSLSKAMALCSQREYCVHDIVSKLKLWTVNLEDTEKIIEVLKKEKFIDEERYSSAFVRDKFSYNKWGKVKLATDLKMKGIPPEIIRNALDRIDPDLYKGTLEKLIGIQRKKIRAASDYELKGKLMRYALSKGFESQLIYDILGDFE